MKVECLDYRQLPGQNSLFLHYLYRCDEADPTCSPVHLSLQHLKQRAEAVSRRPLFFPREKLVSLLASCNETVSTPPAVARNIEKLRSPHTLVLITGQQVGLFGGPALAVYKALTAIRLSQILEEYGVPTVPVFWLASDDSDLQEVRSAVFWDGQDGLLETTYPGAARNTGRMAGALPLRSVDECLGRLEETVSQGDFRDQTIEMLRASYAGKRSFREGLAAWLTALFGDYGLTLFDPLCPGYKKDLQAVFRVAIERRKEIVRALQRRTEFLRKAGFEAQVQVDESETLLFFIEGEKRSKLEYRDGRYRSKTLRLDVDEEQLRRELEKSPEKFGPNVLLRPILQDHLFPTLAYVGGPSEISYFSQVSAISPFWGVEPAVFPRVGLTIVGRKAQRLLGKYDLRISDVFSRSRFEMTRMLLEKGETGQITDQLDRLREGIGGKLESLRKEVGKIDPPLAQMLEHTQRKIFYQVDKVKRRFIINYQTRDAHLGRHLDYLYPRLYPKGKFQERVINFNQFLIEEGPAFIDRLLPALNPFCKGHQVLYV